MEEGWTKAQLERRKLVTYKDMGKLSIPRFFLADKIAAVVQRSAEFEFLKGKSYLHSSLPSFQSRPIKDAIIIVNNL